MNEFYDAYSAYMLLKVKIKHQIFKTAEDMLEATKDCIRKYNNLRSMIPKQTKPSVAKKMKKKKTSQSAQQPSKKKKKNKIKEVLLQPQFMITEKAWVLKETIDAIEELVQ